MTDKAPGADAFQGQTVPNGTQIGTGVRITGTNKIFTQGSVVNTNNNLDVAIQGDGFFQVTLPNGEIRYSRDGSFHTNAAGNIVNSSGFPLSPGITIPPNTTPTVAPDGTISVTSSTTTTSTALGQIQLANFPNPAGLSSEGNNLYQQTSSSGTPILAVPGVQGMGQVQGGFVEQSNVDVVSEMVNLIMAQRSYEFNLRSIKAADEMLQSTSQVVS